MSAIRKVSGTAVATVAATMILSGCESMESGSSATASNEAKVNCYGVNACKGKTACATASNACKGHNSCKGTGWLPMSKAECDAKGGKVKG